jgi:hypothetical protein
MPRRVKLQRVLNLQLSMFPDYNLTDVLTV